jgi:gluconolactonase
VPIRDDGTAGPPEPVIDLSGSQPDGIALAQDGTMFVGCYRPDRVYRIPPGGPAEVFAEDPDGVVLNQPANVAFWGPNLDRLVVSSLGGWSLVAAPAGVRGLPLRYPSV